MGEQVSIDKLMEQPSAAITLNKLDKWSKILRSGNPVLIEQVRKEMDTIINANIEAFGTATSKKKKSSSWVSMPNHFERYNAGVKCDAFKGPCSCGAWHEESCRGYAYVSMGNNGYKCLHKGGYFYNFDVIDEPNKEVVCEEWFPEGGQVGIKGGRE